MRFEEFGLFFDVEGGDKARHFSALVCAVKRKESVKLVERRRSCCKLGSAGAVLGSAVEACVAIAEGTEVLALREPMGMEAMKP